MKPLRLFWARKTNRFLFVLRNTKTYKFTWALVGGKVETGETVYEAMCREITEELGSLPDIVKTIPIEKFTHKKNNFIYETFVNIIEEEFSNDYNIEGYPTIKLVIPVEGEEDTIIEFNAKPDAATIEEFLKEQMCSNLLSKCKVT
mgnify:CR=1 FL=1